MTTFNNIKQFADHLCAEPNEDSIQHRVGKYTSAGISLIPPGQIVAGHKKAKVAITWVYCLKGMAIHSVSINGRRIHDIAKRNHSVVPQDILDYVEAKMDLDVYGRVFYLISDPGYKEAVEKQSKRYRYKNIVTFDMDRPIYKKHSGGILLGGGMCEPDVDIQASPLYYPFTEEDYDQTIQWIEDELDGIRLEYEAEMELEEGCQ